MSLVETKRQLVVALRSTAARLARGAGYQWGHFGACNCGHLAQTLTRRSTAEIHRAALDRKSTWEMSPVDDWADAAVEYCPLSGLPIDDIITEMLDAGLSLEEIQHLEQLSDPRVRKRLPEDRRFLRRNSRDDLVIYLEAWAKLVEEELADALLSKHVPAVLPLAAE